MVSKVGAGITSNLNVHLYLKQRAENGCLAVSRTSAARGKDVRLRMGCCICAVITELGCRCQVKLRTAVAVAELIVIIWIWNGCLRNPTSGLVYRLGFVAFTDTGGVRFPGSGAGRCSFRATCGAALL